MHRAELRDTDALVYAPCSFRFVQGHSHFQTGDLGTKKKTSVTGGDDTSRPSGYRVPLLPGPEASLLLSPGHAADLLPFYDRLYLTLERWKL